MDCDADPLQDPENYDAYLDYFKREEYQAELAKELEAEEAEKKAARDKRAKLDAFIEAWCSCRFFFLGVNHN